MRSSVVLPLVVVLFVFSGCSRQQEAADNLEALKDHLEEFRTLVIAGDAEALGGLYPQTPPPIGFYMWSQRVEGRDAIVEGWRSFFDREDVEDLTFEKVHYRMKGNLGVIWGLFSMTSQAGLDARSYRGRFTSVLGRRNGGSWEVLHDHVSVPVPMGEPEEQEGEPAEGA